MLTRLRQFLRSENIAIFSRSLVIQVAGYAISLALMPVAIAFYTPSDFGMLAVALFAANLLGSYGGLKLEWAIINEHSGRIARFLMRFALSLLICWALAAAVLFLAAPDSVYSYFAIGRLPALLALPAALVTGVGIFQQAWGIRQKAYRDVYLSRNAVMISRQLLQIGLGLLWPSIFSLLLSEIGARSIGIQLIVRRLGMRTRALGPARFLRSARNVLFGRYSHYSTVALPSSLFTFMMTQSLAVVFVPLFGLEVSGAFWLVQRIFGLPMALIGTVAADVFQGQIARRSDLDATRRLTWQTAILLCAFSFTLLPLGALLFWFLTQHFYEGKWALSGQIGLLMIPAFCIQFIASPLSRVLIVREKMHYKLIFDAALFLLLAGWLSGTIAAGITPFSSIALLSAAHFLAYLLYVLISLYVAAEGKSDRPL